MYPTWDHLLALDLDQFSTLIRILSDDDIDEDDEIPGLVAARKMQHGIPARFAVTSPSLPHGYTGGATFFTMQDPAALAKLREMDAILRRDGVK